MGVVTRILEFRDRKDLAEYLDIEYGVKLKEGENKLENIELNTILVNAEIEDLKNETVMRLKKLVSLKAFLLSAEAGMDINKLIFNIDSLMKMSEDGLNWRGGGISDDESLAEFFRAAGIEKSDSDGEIMTDSKRSAKVKKIRGHYDFNTIVEI